jgi:glycosyltransferase involved in cell wall biosynthesis
VTSTGGSCAEVVGEAGLCVDPADPAAIAAGIGRVLGEPGLAAELRRRGLVRSGAFTWGGAARATLAVLAEAAVGKRATGARGEALRQGQRERRIEVA